MKNNKAQELQVLNQNNASFVPEEVHTKNGNLIWKVKKEIRYIEYKHHKNYFDEFRDLANLGPDEGAFLMDAKKLLVSPLFEKGVVAFARKFGVLNLCKHAVPHGIRHLAGEGSLTVLCRLNGNEGNESLLLWYGYSFMANVILRVAGATQKQLSCDRLDFDYLNLTIPKKPGEPLLVSSTHKLLKRTVPNQKRLIKRAVDHWLWLGNVTPRLSWEKSDLLPKFRLQGDGLFGALSIELMSRASQAKYLAICSAPSCLKEFTAVERYGTEDQYFCRECRKKENIKKASRNLTKRKKKAILLFNQKVSYPSIEKQLKNPNRSHTADSEIVMGWIVADQKKCNSTAQQIYRRFVAQGIPKELKSVCRNIIGQTFLSYKKNIRQSRSARS